MGRSRLSVLVVEDSPIDAGILTHYLRQSDDYHVVGLCTTAAQAVALAEVHQPDIVLMDVNLSGAGDGFQAVDAIRTVADPGVVFVTSADDPATLSRVTAASALGFLLKPFDGRTLNAVLHLAVQRHTRDQQLHILEAAVASASIGILLVDVRGDVRSITYANPAFLQMAGVTQAQVLGQRPCFLADPTHMDSRVDELREALRTRTAAEATVPCRNQAGRQFWSRVSICPLHSASGAVTHLLVFHKDVTEQRRAEAALADSQRLELVGLLTAGIAHDMNNILAAIIGFAGLAQADLPDSGEHRRDIAEVLLAADRGRVLIQKLLNFSRRSEPTGGASDICAVAQDLRGMVEQLVGKRARFSVDNVACPLFIPLDRISIEQVLLNLVANARDAMTDRGTITVAIDVPDTPGASHAAGAYVRIQVSDTGRGIAPAHLPRVFDPFFSTKPKGVGTGLGLSTCRSLVESAGGTIHVASELGTGTTFTIELPKVEQGSIEAQPEAPAALQATARGALCLLVEDEPGLRHVCRRVLTQAGFTVVDVDTGEDAIRAVDTHAHELALLVCDLVLPGLQGTDVIAHVRRVAPAVPIIVATGFAHQSVTSADPTLSVLWKPFTADALTQRALGALKDTTHVTP